MPQISAKYTLSSLLLFFGFSKNIMPNVIYRYNYLYVLNNFVFNQMSVDTHTRMHIACGIKHTYTQYDARDVNVLRKNSYEPNNSVIKKLKTDKFTISYCGYTLKAEHVH